MKLNKSRIIRLTKYLTDIKKYGIDNENIDSIDIWCGEAEGLRNDLCMTKDAYFVGLSDVSEAVLHVLDGVIPLTSSEDIKNKIINEILK